MVRFGVLDQSPIRKGGTAAQAIFETIELAKAAEVLGYSRYWLAEHHNTRAYAGTCPEVLIGRVASETSRIRVGSGGVLLSHYSPLKVAEQFRMLETLYPGRIDLGLGRAPGGDGRTAAALQAGPQAYGIDAYPQQVDLLRRYLEDAAGYEGFDADHPYHGIHAVPMGQGLPEMWLLGSGVHSAVYAGAFGLGFTYAHFISSEDGGGGHTGPEIIETYTEGFRPGLHLEAPRPSVAVSVICAPTDEQAQFVAASRNLWVMKLLGGEHTAFVSPEDALSYPYSEPQRKLLNSIAGRSITGSPETVHARLTDIMERYHAEELIILTLTYSFEDRLTSYRLIADAFGLKMA